MSKESPSKFNLKDYELPKEFLGDRVLVRPYQESDASSFWDMQIESRQHLLRWLGGAEDISSLI